MTSWIIVVGGFLKKPLVLAGLSAGFSAIVHLYVTCLIWRRKKSSTVDENKDRVPKIDDSDWIEIGHVKELHYFPLKSGKGKSIENCDFTEYGISVEESGLLTLKDRMLLVYDAKTGKFQTGRNYSKLVLVKISAIDETSVKLEAEGMLNLVFRLPEMENRVNNAVKCTMWWGEPLICVDCGPEPAAWISKYLTGSEDSALRIGSAISDRRNILKGPWKKFTKVYKTLRSKDTGYFADLASYMLMSESSLAELNKRLEVPVSTLQFRPNIVVAGCEAFAEDFWDWIKIGDDVIIRNVKPCPRCAMIRIDPETGVLHKTEPTNTLRSFREQTDPKRVEVDGKYPTMGVYCGLYESGAVKIHDKVFVKQIPAK